MTNKYTDIPGAGHTTAEVEKAFRAELTALLKRWDGIGTYADATIEARHPDYGAGLFEVDIPGIYDPNGNTIRPYTNFTV